MQWTELNFEEAIWTIQASRIKRRLPHTVGTLSPQKVVTLAGAFSSTPTSSLLLKLDARIPNRC